MASDLLSPPRYQHILPNQAFRHPKMTKVANINLSRHELQRMKMRTCIHPDRCRLNWRLSPFRGCSTETLRQGGNSGARGVETQTPNPCSVRLLAITISTDPSAAALLISKIKIARYFKPLQEMLFLFQMTFLFPRNLMF